MERYFSVGVKKVGLKFIDKVFNAVKPVSMVLRVPGIPVKAAGCL
jgi:hypothetical protein